METLLWWLLASVLAHVFIYVSGSVLYALGSWKVPRAWLILAFAVSTLPVSLVRFLFDMYVLRRKFR